MIAEKHKLHEADVKEKNRRINTLRQIANFKIYEKHMQKMKHLQEFQQSENSFTQIF